MYSWIFQEVIDNGAIDFPEPDTLGPRGVPWRWFLWKQGHRSCHRVGSRTRRNTFPKPLNGHFCPRKKWHFCLWRPSQIDPFYLPVDCELFQNLGVSFQQVRARKEEVLFHVVCSWGICPMLSFQSRSSVLCYCFQFRRILLFGYNCDSFLTWAISGRQVRFFFPIYNNLLSYCQ